MSEKQYVIFKLNDEEYGVEISNVKEITSYEEGVKVPDAPDFVDGIINLRGDIVPIINLKKRFKLDTDGIDENSRVIISDINEKLVGFAVDDASRVLTMKDDDVESPPEVILSNNKRFIAGIGKFNDEIIIILDFREILSEEEKQQIQKMQTSLE
ncbi:chemotaxis protein CheW [Caloranaerobacter azorensis]|uniref:Purine-binding chemotaxis protein CheW n=1 Tax=Caloranaerobacter azorensis TaxID=116090 RepID=A0A6P1YEH5_9FIRM|nr:chemotaxis protein CheW [Caloranaerobacter azorensis]QIB27342.1 purine-binding chemotaxis protein CheW [Caloranaerobacter azorensis]